SPERATGSKTLYQNQNNQRKISGAKVCTFSLQYCVGKSCKTQLANLMISVSFFCVKFNAFSYFFGKIVQLSSQYFLAFRDHSKITQL
ncbi:hypothetical protein, partial [Carnobacterium inhibens]|uniref:hypothetical protein n=1 Tax=Carnobacterium inhibens TaxID=147709 RepID=UPI001EE245E5